MSAFPLTRVTPDAYSKRERPAEDRPTASTREIPLVEPEPVFVEYDWKPPKGRREPEAAKRRRAGLQFAKIACEQAVGEIYREIFKRPQASW